MNTCESCGAKYENKTCDNCERLMDNLEKLTGLHKSLKELQKEIEIEHNISLGAFDER